MARAFGQLDLRRSPWRCYLPQVIAGWAGWYWRQDGAALVCVSGGCVSLAVAPGAWRVLLVCASSVCFWCAPLPLHFCSEALLIQTEN